MNSIFLFVYYLSDQLIYTFFFQYSLTPFSVILPASVVKSEVPQSAICRNGYPALPEARKRHVSKHDADYVTPWCASRSRNTIPDLSEAREGRVARHNVDYMTLCCAPRSRKMCTLTPYLCIAGLHPPPSPAF